MKNIYLIGFMGSGKSAVCSRLHELTGMEVIEMDASIVDKEGMSINDIFATKGEEYFRDVESELLYLISEESIQSSYPCPTRFLQSVDPSSKR